MDKIWFLKEDSEKEDSEKDSDFKKIENFSEIKSFDSYVA